MNVGGGGRSGGLKWRRIANTVAKAGQAQSFGADPKLQGLRMGNPAVDGASIWWSDVVDEHGDLVPAVVGQCHELLPGSWEYWSAAGPPIDGISVIAAGSVDIPFRLEKGTQT